MSKSSRSRVDQSSFLRLPSTWVATAIRVSILLAVQNDSVIASLPRSWWESPSLLQILVRPSYTLEHIQEAISIQKLGGGKFVHAYTAQRIQIPPLLLAGLTPLARSAYAEIWISILCILMDLLLAAMLESIARFVLFTNRSDQTDKESKEQEKLPKVIQPNKHKVFAIYRDGLIDNNEKALIPMESLPLLAAQTYYWSPFLILSGSAYHCFQCLPGFFMIASFYEALRLGGSLPLSTFYLATATYLEPHHFVFLFPMVTLQGMVKRKPHTLMSYFFWFLCLHWLSYQLVGSKNIFKVLQATYGLGWKTIRPSLSMHWYFAIQLFSRFRRYFSTLMLGLPYVVVVPIFIRLHKYPMVMVAIYSMLWTIFRPVQTLYDVNLSLCLLLLCPRSLARMGTPAFLAISSMLVPVILNVVDHWMWLGPNTGNANYMYFQCLAFNVFLSIILGQFCMGSLERDKALRIAAKESNGSSPINAASL